MVEYENNRGFELEKEENAISSQADNMEVETVEFQGCTVHDNLPFIGECLICGKKICRECRAERGYFCSDECLETSRNTVDDEARNEFRKQQKSSEKIIKIAKLCVFIVILGFVFLLCKWGYREFLDPAGKIVWQWKKAEPVKDFLFIGNHQGKALVKIEDVLYLIDLSDGKEVWQSSDPRMNKCNKLVKRLNSGCVIIQGERAVAMLKSDGHLGWFKNFKNTIKKVVVAPDDAVLVLTSPEMDLYQKMKAEDITNVLTALEIKNGARRWRKEISAYTYIYDLVAGAGKYVKAVSVFNENKRDAFLEVSDLKTGKAQWKIKSQNISGYNLMIVGNTLLFKIQNVLSAVNLQTRKKLWQIPMKAWSWQNNIKIEDGMILIDNGESLLCVNAEDGKKRWEKKVPESLLSVAYDDGKIYSVFVEYEESQDEKQEVKVDLPPAFDQLKDVDILSGQKADNSMTSRVTRKSFLTCQDMNTGKELWRKSNVNGVCVASQGKLVVLCDTQLLNLLSVSNDGKGSLIIRQYNPENGDRLFERVVDTGLAEPYCISGNQLIGCEYERISSGVGALHLGQEKTYLGLASFLLK